MQPGNARINDDLVKLRLANQDMIRGFLLCGSGNAKTGAGVALWIEVNNQDRFANGRERRSEIDRSCRLAHATLLVGNGKDA